MAEIMAEFLPPGVFNVVCGDPTTGAALVMHKIPAMASITGSVRAGLEVAKAAASDLKRVHLELGGQAPVIVFDDADIAAPAAPVAVAGSRRVGPGGRPAGPGPMAALFSRGAADLRQWGGDRHSRPYN